MAALVSHEVAMSRYRGFLRYARSPVHEHRETKVSLRNLLSFARAPRDRHVALPRLVAITIQ
jgi:hypothetical protein